jgi:hypothetical protein
MTIRRDRLATRSFVLLLLVTGLGIITRSLRPFFPGPSHPESLTSLLLVVAVALGIVVFHRLRGSLLGLQLDAPAIWLGWGLGWGLLHTDLWWDDIWSVSLIGWQATALLGGAIVRLRFEPRVRWPLRLLVIAAVTIGLMAVALPTIYWISDLLKRKWIVVLDLAIAVAGLTLIADMVSRRPRILVAAAVAVLLASGAIGSFLLEIRGVGVAPRGYEWLDRVCPASYVILLLFGVVRLVRWRSRPGA